MSTTGLPVFDTTVQQTNLWLKALMEQVGTNDRHLAYGILRASLHALRDRLGPENAVHLAAQLPMLLRGLYYEGWRPSKTPTRERSVDAFLQHVCRELPQLSVPDIETGVRAVFTVLWQRIHPEEMGKIVLILPQGLRDLAGTPSEAGPAPVS